MGGLVDQTIPKHLQKTWSSQQEEKGRIQWQPSYLASWTNAKPLTRRQRRSGSMPPLLTKGPTGSCACGKHQYSLRHAPTELQHCYCRLCRQFSGSAFQTWIPVDNQDIVWNTAPPPLQRTTNHGQRHICTTCGGVLTIVYDEQPDCTWPAAGGLDDDNLPKDVTPYLERVCHICCTWKQDWYTIPKDGLERIQYAC